MIFTNQTGFPSGWTTGFRRDGREQLVVVVKAGFRMPAPGGAPMLLDVQLPLVEADVFTGEPGLSAPLYETDYAHEKPGCDVLLVGSAHAPGGRPVERCEVSLAVGALRKQFMVVGPRVWHKRAGTVSASRPEPFVRLPLSYDSAWGGTDRTREAQGEVLVCRANPVGVGFCHHTQDIDGQPLPHTEQAGQPVRSPRGEYRPQAFSPIGRSWLPRSGWAGTYDDAWLADRSPFWPDDFDTRYFQAAPPDQVMSYPKGGEPVVLQNLCAQEPTLSFRLPVMRMPVTFIPFRGQDLTVEAHIDTVVLEPDDQRFSMTWRCTLPLGRSVFDVRETIVGAMPPAWHRARRFAHKTYYPSLAEAVRARRARRGTA